MLYTKNEWQIIFYCSRYLFIYQYLKNAGSYFQLPAFFSSTAHISLNFQSPATYVRVRAFPQVPHPLL